MAKEEHTPGPWKWYKADPPPEREDGASLADLWNSLEHEPMVPGIGPVLTYSYTRGDGADVQIRCSPADARLIAAAPALLAACTRFLQLHMCELANARERKGIQNDRPCACGCCAEARAAIAEATGE